MLRTEVMTFAQAMESQLRVIDSEDWKELTYTCLFSTLESEVRDLKESLINGNSKEIIRDAINVGITTMQIADKARKKNAKSV